MVAIEFDNVSFAYPTGLEDENPNIKREPRYVLKDFSVRIEEGTFVALLGRNGSGKSTMAKLTNGLLMPSKGKITVLGHETANEDELFEIRKNTGLVFQNPDNQQIASIVEDDIAFGPENIGLPREEIGRRIDEALKITDMEKYRKTQVSRLSGGQKQRVAIAGVLALGPKIIILDESTSMLDPKGRKEVMDVVRQLNRENGMTVIDITHYMDEAIEADRIYVMDKGVIAMEGSPEEIFSKPEEVRACGLELPRAAIIASELRKKGVPVKGNVLTKEELLEELCKLLPKT